MRRILLPLLTLLSLTPLAAHADQIDDFTLTSAHHIYTFSLPTPYYTGPTFGHPDTNFAESGPGTIDGVGGYTLGAYFYDAPGYPRSGLDFSLPGNDTYQLNGPDLGGYSTPFMTGTFQYTDYPYNNLHYTTVLEDGPYTLSITAEAPTSVTPEPATLTLLATGSLGLLTRLHRRRSRG